MSELSLPAGHEWASADFLRDPYPFYARLRSRAGPYWLPHLQETSSGGIWLFSRYQEAQQIFTSTEHDDGNQFHPQPWDRYAVRQDHAAP